MGEKPKSGFLVCLDPTLVVCPGKFRNNYAAQAKNVEITPMIFNSVYLYNARSQQSRRSAPNRNIRI